jgi:2-oxoglutarate ferredoxin oxidoreductase subunit alpha
MKFGAELPVSGSTIVIYDEKTGVAEGQAASRRRDARRGVARPHRGYRQTSGIGSDKRQEHRGARAHRRVVRHRARGHPHQHAKEAREEGRRAARRQREGLRPRRDLRGRAPARAPMRDGAARRGGRSSCSPTATTCAPPRPCSRGSSSSAAIPITPSTEIMQYLSKEIWKYGGAVLQAEDEIAGIGAAVGASFAGQEGDDGHLGPGHGAQDRDDGAGLDRRAAAGDRQRAARRALDGLPTKPSSPTSTRRRSPPTATCCGPVLAPTSVADTFAITVEAFNIAERYQTPVILLSDQEIAQRKETVDPIDTSQASPSRSAGAPPRPSSPTTRASASPSPASARSATRG